MSLSLREGIDFQVVAADGAPSAPAQLAVAEQPAYEPEITEYLPDPRNDRIGKLQALVKERRVTLQASFALADGRREFVEFNAEQAAEYLNGDVTLRERIVGRRVLERHLSVAREAARRLSEGRRINVEQDACLREFGGLVSTLRESDGSISDVLQEGFVARADRALEAVKAGNVEALREDGFFDGGGYNEPSGYFQPWSEREWLPRGSPAFRQQLIADVWDTLAKCWYAWTHDPIIREGCAMLTEFPLGRGVQISAKDDKLQDFLDAFMTRTRMPRDLRVWANSLSRDGELFIRIIRNGDGTVDLLAMPPETIWEIVTDGENVKRVFYYVQRYPTRYQMDAVDVPAAQVQYIERTIAASDVIHIKVNADAHDVRGRSDIFPALAWAKRLRDYLDAEVQKAQALAAYQWWIKVKGGPADMQRVAGSVPGAKPAPGSSWITNDGVEVGAVASNTKGVAGNGSSYEALLNQIAIAFGVPKDYFGVTSRGSRATALVASEPAAKRFEDRQDTLSDLVGQIIDAAIAEAQRYGLLEGVEDLTYRSVFPSIIKADASTRSDLLRTAKAEGVISHRMLAQELTGEADIEDYDYDAEQAAIRKEIGVPGWELSAKDSESVKRGLPDKNDVAFDPGEVPNPNPGEVGGSTIDSTGADAQPQGKTTASPASATGAAAIRKDNEARERRVREAMKTLHAAGATVILP